MTKPKLLASLLLSLVACSSGSTPGGGGGSSAGGGGSPATTPPADERLCPLEVGRVWTYDVQSTYPACPNGQQTTKVVGTSVVDGKTAFDVVDLCGNQLVMTVDGDVLESKQGGYPWLRLLDEPVEEGHTWTTTNGSATFGMKYESAGSVTTAAGTFDDCWRVVQQVSYQQDWTYCRGVGLVASKMVDMGGGQIVYEITAKSF